MPRYRVTLRRTTVEIVEAANPYQAAIAARDLGGDRVEIADVVPTVGRPSTSTVTRPVKKAAKKRRPMSPETRAKLAQNLVKARAARAANQKKRHGRRRPWLRVRSALERRSAECRRTRRRHLSHTRRMERGRSCAGSDHSNNPRPINRLILELNPRLGCVHGTGPGTSGEADRVRRCDIEGGAACAAGCRKRVATAPRALPGDNAA
jgi:hypothetical protein